MIPLILPILRFSSNSKFVTTLSLKRMYMLTPGAELPPLIVGGECAPLPLRQASQYAMDLVGM